MSFDYPRAEATAQRLIRNFGQTMTFTPKGAATGPAYDPTFSAGTPVTVTAVVLQYSDRDRAGTRINTGDRKVILSTAGLSVTPTTEDTIDIDGVPHQIIEAMPLRPGGSTVMHTLQVRA